MIIINVINSYRYVVSICDKELLGKVFESEKFQLDVKESFYKGEEIEEEKAIHLIRKMSMEDATFNIVGEKSVNVALKAGIIAKEGIKKIQGVPFALVLL
jgi:hypothetical protein